MVTIVTLHNIVNTLIHSYKVVLKNNEGCWLTAGKRTHKCESTISVWIDSHHTAASLSIHRIF